MPSNFVLWVRKLAPFPQVSIEEIEIPHHGGIFDYQAASLIIDLPLFEPTRVSLDYLNRKKLEISEDLSLSMFFENLVRDVIPLTPLVAPSIDEFSTSIRPEIPTEDRFIKLPFPRIKGHSYADDELHEGGQIALPFDANGIDRTICRHGNPWNACPQCDAEDDHRRERERTQLLEGRSLDIFQLLRPILMPPFEQILEGQEFFTPIFRPKPYQVAGIKFLMSHENALLGDEMGLGKTIQAIIAIRILMRKGKVNNVLIVCPVSLLGNWKKELSDWAPELNVIRVRGTQNQRAALWQTRSMVHLASYESLREDIENGYITRTGFSAIILDEIQRIKNPEARISQAVRRLDSTYRWGLSGTPLENRVEDVVAIFKFIKPDLRFPYPDNPASVKELIKSYVLRRRIQDVEVDLPEKQVNEFWLDLNEEQQTAYDNEYTRAKEEIRIRGAGNRIYIFSLINRLKLICNEEETSGSSCKKDFVIDRLESLLPEEKAIIFSHFPDLTLEKLKITLANYNPELYSGELNQRQRDSVIDRFINNENSRVLLISLRAGGVGLNLQVANHVFHFDHWWNPATTRQAEGRAYRIGQSRTVFIYDIFTNGTIEEKIYNILAKKQELFQMVIDDLTTETVSGNLTDEELYSLFDLKPPRPIAHFEEINSPEKIKEKIRLLSASEFESLIGKVFEKKGYSVQVRGAPHDGGVDITATGSTRMGIERLSIQCKHYYNGTVGPEVVREAIGTHRLENTNRFFLVTSGVFSQEANRAAQIGNIDLMDISTVIGEIINLNLDI